MLFLLSPAKSLNESHNDGAVLQQQPTTQPQFLQQSAKLIKLLQTKSVEQVGDLMKLSPQLAQLNYQRFQVWQANNPAKLSYPSIWLFNGDVYEGLEVASLDKQQLQWLQQHTVILSGLYGAIKPFDAIQPYRLEMGTKLIGEGFNNLYQFWDDQISQYLNQQLLTQQSKLIINLASQEYSKVVKAKLLTAQIVDCVFEDYKNQQYKIISFYAKRARGLMLRFAAIRQAQSVEELSKFNLDGYSFADDASTATKLVFRRKTVSSRQ